MTAPAAFARPSGPQDPGDLDARTWTHRSGAYRAVHHDFDVRTDDPALGRYLDRLFAPFRVGGTPPTSYSVLDHGPGAPRRYELYWGARRLARTARLSRVVAVIQWHVNQEVVRSAHGCVLVHAAGLERDGVGIALPAPTESGKTTLAAGLIQAGLRYLTDEALAIDVSTRLARPYPKALSIDGGSWSVLGCLRPSVAPGLETCLDQQWQVPATDIRRDALAPAVPLRFVVAPRYIKGAETTLEPVTRARGLVLLAEATFGWGDDASRNFGVLADVVAGCRCYRLTVGDLDGAVALLLDLTAGDPR